MPDSFSKGKKTSKFLEQILLIIFSENDMIYSAVFPA